MNKIILFVILGLGACFLSSCGEAKEKHATAAKSETAHVVVIEEDEMDEIPSESDLDFEDALEAFQEGDHSSAAAYIYTAIEDIKAESAGMTGDAKAKIEMSVAGLKKLAEKIEKGEIKSDETLADAFNAVEMRLAHDYFIFSNYYFPTQPLKAKSHLATAIAKMENAVKVMEGTAKKDGQALLAESKKLLDQLGDELQADAKPTVAAIRKQSDKIGNWLEKHSTD